MPFIDPYHFIGGNDPFRFPNLAFARSKGLPVPDSARSWESDPAGGMAAPHPHADSEGAENGKNQPTAQSRGSARSGLR